MNLKQWQIDLIYHMKKNLVYKYKPAFSYNEMQNMKPAEALKNFMQDTGSVR